MAEGSGKTKGRKAAGYLAVLVSVLTVFIMLFSAFYVVSEADHDCCGEDCPICAHIDQCQMMIRGMDDCAPAIGIAAFLAVISRALLLPMRGASCLSTPVTCKDRMNY